MTDERKITDIKHIDEQTETGRLLLAALIELTTRLHTGMTTPEVIQRLHEIAEKTYGKDRPDSTYVESMTKINLNTGGPVQFIRCWRMEQGLEFDGKQTEREILEVLNKDYNSLADAAKAVLALDRMNAVEFLDIHGNGVVLYKNWP